MKDSNRQFEETGAFLDLMSKKERKRWEKELQRLKESEMNKDTIENKDEDKLENQAEKGINDNSDSFETFKYNEENIKREKELESTINTTSPKEDKICKTFNYVLPLGLILIIMFGLFIFLTLFTKYDNNMFLTINSTVLLFLSFCFGLTVLSNRKHVKVFAIIDLLIIIGFTIFNVISITNYTNIYDKSEKISLETNTGEIKPIVDSNKEKDTINEYNCTNEAQTTFINIKEENNYIKYIKRVETLENNEIMTNIIKFYQNKTGISASIEDNTMIIEFDFNNIDIDQYKSAIKENNDYYRLESDFSYIDNNKINYTKYINIEAKNLTCTKIKNEQ